MGGRSFKCPLCEKWFLDKAPLRDHLLGKHARKPPFEIRGTGSAVEIVPPSDIEEPLPRSP